MLGLRTADPSGSRETELNDQIFAYLRDHRVDGTAIFPAAGYVEIGLALESADGEARTVEDLEFHAPLILGDGDAPILRVSHDAKRGTFAVHWRRFDEIEGWIHCASGVLPRMPFAPPCPPPQLDRLRETCSIEVTDVYERLARFGLHYGPAFRGIEACWRGPRATLARIAAPPEGGRYDARYRMHPVTLDAAVQLVVAAADDAHDAAHDQVFMTARTSIG